MPANIYSVAWADAVMSSSILPTCGNPEDRFTACEVSVHNPEMDLGSRGLSLALGNMASSDARARERFLACARYARLSSSGKASLP